MNPNAMVPVIDDEVSCCGSQQHPALSGRATWRQRALSGRNHACARIDQWLDWQASDLNRSWSYAFMALARKSPEHGDAQQVAASIAGWTRFMQVLEQQLQHSGGFVGGACIHAGRYSGRLSVNRWFGTPLEHAPLPAVAAYFERLSERPGFRAYGRNGMA
jgi:glutathione S-transferase